MRRERIGPGGLAGLQNRDGGAFGDSGGFDSHTLPPPRLTRPGSLTTAIVVLLLAAAPIAAQDTTVVAPAPLPPRAPLPQDTLAFPQPPVRPMGALLRSLAIPGWSQALLGRRLTAGLFIAWEGITLGMTVKADRELAHLKAEGSGLVEQKRQERQDWLVLLGFNHLFAGLEAFVGSHLWDFPDDVRLRPAAFGTGIVVSVPISLR